MSPSRPARADLQRCPRRILRWQRPLCVAVWALLALGCERLAPGELGEPSLVLRHWSVVSEKRLDRTAFEYLLRAECANAGGEISGAAALVVSKSAATTVTENQIRCGPIAAQSVAPTLDTITIRHDRTTPFDPNALTGVALIWGPETQESEERADRVHFDYGYYAYLESGLDTPVDVVATVESTAGATEILDATVAQAGLEPLRRRAATDRFGFRHDRSVPFDPTALVWTIGFGSSRPGFAAGEVYDDATGRALAGVRVRALGGSADPETITDAHGAYQLPLASGLAVLGFTRDGYTPAWREVALPGGAVATPLDARLRPRTAAALLTVRDGGNLASAGGVATLDVPIGGLRADAPVTLTDLGAQALPAPLPLGWAPLASFEIETGGVALSAPLALVLPGASLDPERNVAVRFDTEMRRWLRIELGAATAGGVSLPVEGAGAIALVRRDLAPASPPLPEIGAALEGVAAVPVPEAASAELLPSPRVLFAASDARAEVRALLRTPAPLPSGTPIRVDFAERYQRIDATSVEPPPMAQDVLLYPGAEGPEAGFVATPAPEVEPAALREGTIDLAAHAGAEAAGAAVLDGTGGTLESDGIALVLPPGALAAPVAASLAPFTPLDPALTGDLRISVLAGAAVDLGGAALAAPAQLALPLPPGVDLGEDLLVVVSPRTVLGATRWELVARARREGDRLLVEASDDPALPLPGVRSGDRYAIVRLLVPAGFVTGDVQAASGAPAADAVVSADTLPFIARTEPGDPSYAVAAGLGAAALAGLDLATGDAASASTSLTSTGAIVRVDLALASQAFTVSAVEPAPDEKEVALAAAVVVRLSGQLDPASLDESAAVIEAGGALPAVSRSLATDGRDIVLRPAAPLAPGVRHSVRLAATLRDVLGRSLAGNQPDGSFSSAFTTVDTTAPPRPEAGLVTVSIPDDGVSQVLGTQGAAPPGALVFVTNRTRGLVASGLAGADGSFAMLIAADGSDELRIAIIGTGGAVTELDPIPFANGAGTFLLGPLGGTASTPAGVRAALLPRALVRTGAVRLRDVALDALPAPLPAGVSAVTAFSLDFEPDLVARAVELSVQETDGRFPERAGFSPPLRVEASFVAPDTTSSASRFRFAARALDGLGDPRTLVVETAGRSTSCSESTSASDDATAPRLRLRAPRCLGPAEAFTISAEAVQPRFDVSVPAPPGTDAGDLFLVLRRDVARNAWLVEELATAGADAAVLRVSTGFAAPDGIRSPGTRAVVRAATPLAFVEGRLAGDASLVTTDVLPGLVVSAAANRAFLVPVPAGVAFELRRLDPTSGAVLETRALGPLAEGATDRIGRLGAGAGALAVAAELPPGAALAGRSPLRLAFSEAVDAATVTRASVIVVDARGRAVDGYRSLDAGGARVAFHPKRPWHFGESYAWRVTTEVTAANAATLDADSTGGFEGFAPHLVATIAGADIVDAVAIAPRVHLLDAGDLRSVELADPASPAEGTRRALRPAANALALAAPGGTPVLLVAAGTLADYGELQRLSLASPLAPVLAGARELSTPAGAPTRPGVSAAPGVPAALAVLDDVATIASRGIGLQRVPLAELGVAPSEPPHELSGEAFADVAAGEDRLVSIAAGELVVHDPASLAALARAPVDGTPLDVELTRSGGRVLALVAAGLAGGVQVYEIGDDGVPARIAKVTPGCLVTRVAADGVLGRAWLACTGARLAGLDLAFVEGLEPIDEDGDGSDDRLAGRVELPGPLADLDLDRGRALALVSQHGAGLAAVVLGPAEARIEDVQRDVLPGDHGDVFSIASSGRAFAGDQAVLVEVEARIPPGHPGLRAAITGDAPLAFEDGGREIALAAGRQTLRLVPETTSGAASTRFELRLLDANETLASFAGAFDPVPLDRIVSIDADDVAAGAAAVALVVEGRDDDDVLYHLTPLARFETTDPVVGSVGVDGRFTPTAGGETEILYTVEGRSQSLRAVATLPPAVAYAELAPAELQLRPGEHATLAATGELTDGTVRSLGEGDGLVLASSDPAIATVDAAGEVRALTPGEVTITVSPASGDPAASRVVVTPFVAPDVTGIELAFDRAQVSLPEGVLGAQVRLAGAGSLDRIEVELTLESVEGPQVERAVTELDGSASTVFAGVAAPGTVTVRARAVDPGDGEAFETTRSVPAIARNADVEPNDSAATAILLETAVPANGEVGGSDAADFFRVSRDVGGTLSLALSGDVARLAVLDATGGVVTEASGDGAPLTVAIEPSATPLVVRVASAGGRVAYSLAAALTAAAPVIERIEPPSGAPGTRVALIGRGFSPRAERDEVFFQGLRTDVLLATPERIEVLVPAFATDGPVVLWVDAEKSNEFAFATGATQHWFLSAFRAEIAATDVVEDLETGGPIVRDRVEAAFQSAVTRERVETLAAGLGAEIVGIWPPRNAYEFRFAGADPASLRGRLAALEALPDVRYARLLQLAEPDGFPIAGRDDLPGRQTPISPVTTTDARKAGAYAQIRAFEAWQWLADSGFFTRHSDFGTVHVGVIDIGFVSTPMSVPQFAQNQMLFPRDFNVLVNPSVGSHGVRSASLIGALNVDEAAVHSTGILGGALPPDASLPAFYTVDLYDAANVAGTIDSREEELAIKGCPGAPAVGGVLPPCATPLLMDVVNMSYGVNVGPGNGNPAFYRDIVKSRPGTLFVASAGNEMRSADKHYPSAVSLDADVGVSGRSVSVAAVGTGWRREPGDARADVRTSFSNFGLGVDIAAPGDHVLAASTFPEKASVCRPGLLPANSSFDFHCGTSAAAPLTAGTAALMKAVSPTLTPAELKRMLIASATPIGDAPNVVNWFAWATPRRIDVLRAVQLAARHRAQLAASDPDGSKRFLPGGRRYLWAADRDADTLVRIKLGSFYEQGLNPADLDLVPPQDLVNAGCSDPYAVTPSASGDKLYIACRANDAVLVWWANANRPADYADSPIDEAVIPLVLGTASYSLPEFPSIQMGLSPDGQILAVPLAGRRVAFIDTRTDRLVAAPRFANAVNIGQVRAVAFGSDAALYAVTSELPSPSARARGQLARKPRNAIDPRWRIDQASGLDVEPLFAANETPQRDAPRGLAILPRAAGDQIYVFYTGDRSETAATVHSASNLELLDPPGGLTGRIRSNVPGRTAEIFKAGDLVGSTLGAFTVRAAQLRTATSLAAGLGIDPIRQRAYMLFRGTGNLAFLEPHAPSSSFQQLASTTSIHGFFGESRTEQRAELETQMRADGSIDVSVTAPLRAREQRLYEQLEFPLSFAIDPEGKLAAGFYAGLHPFVRFWSTKAIQDADQALATQGKKAFETTLDEVASAPPPPLFADITNAGVSNVAALGFGPTLVSAAPGPGAITRGVVAVHPVTRDTKFNQISCKVRNATTRAVVRTDPGTAIAAADAVAGFPSRAGTAALGDPIPVCRFRNLPRGSYILVLRGQTQFGESVESEMPFLHEAW
jgi:hypothetical protein